MPDDDLSPHLEPGVVAAYVEGHLTMADQALAELHMAACRDCREEVAHVSRMLRAPRRRWLFGAGGLAAAAAVVLVLANPARREPVGEVPLRSTAGGTSIAALGPDSTHSAAGARRFLWRATEPGARYDFTLTAEDGSTLFTASTADTGLVLPDSVTVSAGRTYLWFVDALRADGRAASTGVQVLRVTP